MQVGGNCPRQRAGAREHRELLSSAIWDVFIFEMHVHRASWDLMRPKSSHILIKIFLRLCLLSVRCNGFGTSHYHTSPVIMTLSSFYTREIKGWRMLLNPLFKDHKASGSVRKVSVRNRKPTDSGVPKKETMLHV